mmetsp:Transcript_60653/g.173903  ORF Transcript_60653/g.173903 Transcript_60653/m.173903 type:complete len:201 (-) Transcript_60653:4-606(-)
MRPRVPLVASASSPVAFGRPLDVAQEHQDSGHAVAGRLAARAADRRPLPAPRSLAADLRRRGRLLRPAPGLRRHGRAPPLPARRRCGAGPAQRHRRRRVRGLPLAAAERQLLQRGDQKLGPPTDVGQVEERGGRGGETARALHLEQQGGPREARAAVPRPASPEQGVLVLRRQQQRGETPSMGRLAAIVVRTTIWAHRSM